MANGIAQSFIGGRGAALQQVAQQQQTARGAQQFGLQQQSQQAELDRFTNEDNLKSMVQGALQIQNITNPMEQDAFLNRRIQEITARGGDPRDTIELLQTPPEQRKSVIDNVIGIGERFGVIKPTQKAAQGKFGAPFAAVGQGGKDVFAQTIPGGGVREVPGIIPRPRTGETITTTPEGGVTITRGVAASPKLDKQIIRNLSKSIINNEQNLSRLDRIGSQFIPEFLTFGGRIGATISSLKSKAGVDLKPEDRKFLQNRRKFTQNINQVFNAYRKEITGAAASVQELESLKKAMLSEDLSPAEFQASFDEFRRELQRSNRLSRKVLRDGLPGSFGKNLDALFTSGADDNADVRGEELLQEGLTEDQVFEKLESEGF